VFCGQPGYEYFEIHVRQRLEDLQSNIGQTILRAPSVFNFYTPEDRPAGPVSEQGLVAPEFTLMDANQYLAMQNYFDRTIYMTTVPYADRESHQKHLARMNVDALLQTADDTDALLQQVNILLLGGTMSHTLRDIILDYLATQNNYANNPLLKVQDVLSLVVASPEFMLEGK
jgi:hypothetical protein